MQIEALKVFCDVARQQSFSRAASANHISQSAVSQIVHMLEKRLGVRLVDRSKRPLLLTREGRTYYDGCRRLVDEYQGVEAAVRGLNGAIESTVLGAAIYSVGLRDMSRDVHAFEERHPGVHVELEYLHPDQVVARVLDGTADFGLVSFPKTSRRLVALPWKEEEMVVACPPVDPLAARRSTRVAELNGRKYVGFNQELLIRRKVDRFLRDHDLSVDVALEFDNIENIKQAIEVGEGVALLPLPVLERDIDDGRLAGVPLSDARFVRPLGIIHRRNPRPNSNVQRFIELLRQPDEVLPDPRRRGGRARGNGGV